MSHRLLFHVLDSPARLVLGGLAILAAAMLVVKLLQFERQLVPPAASRWLLGLRLAVIVLIGIALAEPAVTLSHDLQRQGRIIVAIDRSESMTMTDAQATSAERLQTARGLGLVGNETINPRLDRWTADFQAGREPTWLDPGETQDPQRQQQLQDIRRANLDEVLAAAGRLSRQEIINRLVQDSSPLITSLQSVGRVEYRVFGGRAETIAAAAVAATAPESVDASRTDLSTPLVTSGGSDDTPVTAIVILSDGRQTESTDPLVAANRLGEQSIPVYTVPIGSTRLPRDLAIGAVDAPGTVFGNDTLRLTATIRTGGFRNRPVAVSLFPADAPQEATVQTITPTGDSHEVTFEWTASRLGRQRLIIRAEPHPDEIRDDNNQKELLVNVVDDVARVLLIDGEARWEFRFIDNALTRDERVDVDQVVFSQPFLSIRNEPFFSSRLEVPDGEDPLERSVLADSDLVIVGDAGPESLDQAAWSLLESFVSDAGGTLVMVAGKRDLPNKYRFEAFKNLIPVDELVPLEFTDDQGRRSPTRRGFGIALSPEGQREPMLQFHLDPTENRRVWDTLPGHTWGLVGVPRPGSTVLARPSFRGRPTRIPDPKHQALFVHHYHGLGQVLWLGIDSTWRWRHRTGDTYHHRFWGQLARWAAHNKAVSGNASVRLGVETAEVTAGEPIQVNARWRRDVLERIENLAATAEFHAAQGPGESPLATIPLTAVDGRPLLWRGQGTGLPAGDYQVRLSVSDPAIDTSGVTASVFVHPATSGELNNLSADHDRLAELATATGGRLVTLDKLDDLADLVVGTSQRQARVEDMLIWNHWAVLVGFFVLMTAEWVIRKVHGLP
ncbi:MAG: hypothetical protein VX311_03805 [Planctomycetota bacterium]|nr:hypothetical protein [Planctomycetota bacterium]MEE3283686.1 hypothetical protein [Planctomycetota bacterium]